MLTYNHKIYLLLSLTSIGIITVLCIHPIPQNIQYHTFADSRTLLSIPNFFNVVSNGLFLLFGLCGMLYLIYQRCIKNKNDLFLHQLFFFTGIGLTGIGSGYYHLHPHLETLVWDRLPMTLSFMSFFSIILAEYIDATIGKRLLFPLLILGLTSVMYWYQSEKQGMGDLRFYVLIQFLPLLLIPLILLLFKSKDQTSYYYYLILILYALAKITESCDEQLFNLTHLVSGHSLKHLLASFVPFIYWWKLYTQQNRSI